MQPPVPHTPTSPTVPAHAPTRPHLGAKRPRRQLPTPRRAAAAPATRRLLWGSLLLLLLRGLRAAGAGATAGGGCGGCGRSSAGLLLLLHSPGLRPSQRGQLGQVLLRGSEAQQFVQVERGVVKAPPPLRVDGAAGVLILRQGVQRRQVSERRWGGHWGKGLCASEASS